MSTEGFSNKVLIGNWFEDRIQEDYLNQFENKTTNGDSTKIVNKVIMDFGYV